MNLTKTYKRNGIFSLVLAFGFLSHNEALPKGGHSRSAARGSRASRYGRPILVIVPNAVVEFEGQKGVELNVTSEELTLEEDEVSGSKVPLTRQFNLLYIICFAGAAVGALLLIRVCAGRFNVKQTRKCQKNCQSSTKCQPNLLEGTKGYKKVVMCKRTNLL